jgi:hypothetical protein
MTARRPLAGGPGKEVAVAATIAGTAGGGIGLPDLPVVKVNGPADLVNLVPWLLGFRPGDRDLVVIGTVPPRGRVQLTFRYDLPGQPDPLFTARTRRAVAALAVQGCTRVLVVGFGPDRLVAPAVAVVREAVKAAGLVVGDALRVEGDRCWSYLCTQASCCPPDGIPCGPAGGPVVAAFEAAGAPAPLASRAVLAAVIAPVGGAEAEAMRLSMRKAEARAARLTGRRTEPGKRTARSPLASSGVRAVAAALRTYQAGGSITSCDQLAWLARALDDQEVRDEAWLRMDHAHREAHQRLWTDLTRAAPPEYQAAPASLLALVAWQDGNGPLAHVALDRALAARPGYPMAHLLRMAIDHGAPPSMADPARVRRAVRAATKRRAQPDNPINPFNALLLTPNERTSVDHDALTGFDKVSLDRLKLAADVILSEADAIPDSLEVEVVLFRERVEQALLLPGKPAEAGG